MKSPACTRRYRDAAIRVAAIRGVLIALPNATDSEIARALKIGRDSVWRHRHGKTKADPRNAPVWEKQFIFACKKLAAGDLKAFREIAAEMEAK
jgi:hypothetical protein